MAVGLKIFDKNHKIFGYDIKFKVIHIVNINDIIIHI